MLWILLAVSEPSRWTSPAEFGSFADGRLLESSGLAPSYEFKDNYYTHNDSGDKPRFFRFDKKGVNAVFNLKGANAFDWEDMASVRRNGRSWLYFGDFGDNSKVRETVVIYRLKEPNGGSGAIEDFDTYTFKYQDGPHNCEAMFVDPGTGHIYLVTKEKSKADVFVLDSPKTSGVNVARKLGEIRPNTGMGEFGRLVTAASTDPQGKHVIIRTYSGALEYNVTGKYQDWWQSKPQSVTMPLDPQGEAICYSSDGKRLLTSTEGTPCHIHFLTLAPKKQ